MLTEKSLSNNPELLEAFKFNPIAAPFIFSPDNLPEYCGNNKSYSGSESGGSNEDMVQRLRDEHSASSFSDVFSFNDSNVESAGNNAWQINLRSENGSLSPGGKSDRNSTSYGSFQHGSYLSDTWQSKSESEGRSEEAELSWRFNEKFKSRFGHREENGDGGYYSPFSTGVYLHPLNSDDESSVKNHSYKSLFSTEDINSPWSKTPVKTSIAEEGEMDDSLCCSIINNMLKGFDDDSLIHNKDFDDVTNKSIPIGGSLKEKEMLRESFLSELPSSDPACWMNNIPNFNSNFLPKSTSCTSQANQFSMNPFGKQDQQSYSNPMQQSFLEQQQQQLNFQQQQQQLLQRQQQQQQQAEAMKQQYLESIIHNINPEQYLRETALNNAYNMNQNVNNLAFNNLLNKQMTNNSSINSPQFKNQFFNGNAYFNSPSSTQLNNSPLHNPQHSNNICRNNNQSAGVSPSLQADLANYYNLLQLQTAKDKQESRSQTGSVTSPFHLRNLNSPAQNNISHPIAHPINHPILKQQFNNKLFHGITPQQQIFQQHQQMLQQQQQLRHQQQQINYINHALTGFNYPASRPIKRSGPANELHQRLEECYEQYKSIENERKRTEAELARQNPGKNVSSDNYRPLPPQLSQNPSRVDRLVLETIKEHSRVETLLDRMEELQDIKVPLQVRRVVEEWRKAASKVQMCRKDEILNAINKHLIKNPQQQKEKDVLALASSLDELSTRTREARSALWSGLQLCSVDLPRRCMVLASKTAKVNVWKNKIEKVKPKNGLKAAVAAVDDDDEDTSSLEGSDIEEI